jgi:hypothetical protein
MNILRFRHWALPVVILIVLASAVALVYAAPSAYLYKGGESDGYDYSSLTNKVIPLPLVKGTLLILQ